MAKKAAGKSSAKVATKKAAGKKASVKKAVLKKPAAKKALVGKSTAKKTSAKNVVSKPAAKPLTAKLVKKVAAKKVAPAKKTPMKTATPKKVMAAPKPAPSARPAPVSTPAPVTAAVPAPQPAPAAPSPAAPASSSSSSGGESSSSTPSGPAVGSLAPDFRLPTTPEGYLTLSQFRGHKNVVLYFYPRDNTPGCTTEACDFRDSLTTLAAADTIVVGVSTDSIASHKGFADKHSLAFPLLADEQHEVADKFGVWVEKSMYGRQYWGVDRSTFLIDKQGRIAARWNKVDVKGHASAVRQAVAALPH